MTTTSTDLEQSVHRALALHKQGNLADAEPLYVAALQSLPDHPDLLHMYGVLQHQQGKSAPAIELISRAIKADPRNAAFQNNLGEVLRLTGQHSRAIEAFRKAIRIDSRYLPAHLHLGNCLLEVGRAAEAMAAYKSALALDRNHIRTLQMMALAADALKDNDQALTAFDRLAGLLPDDAETAINRALLLARLKRHLQAAAEYERAILLDPARTPSLFPLVDCLDAALKSDPAALRIIAPRLESAFRRLLVHQPAHVETHVRLALLLASESRTADALVSIRTATTLAPADPIVIHHLANILQHVPLIDESIAAYERALALNANLPGLHTDYAAALSKRGRLDEALAAADRAIALDSSGAAAWNIRATILQDLGRAADAIDAFITAADLAPDSAPIASNLLYARHYIPQDPTFLYQRHLAWSHLFAIDPTRATAFPAGASSATALPGGASSTRPLRIGLVSPDFKTHSVAYFLEPLLAHADPARLHITCYSNVPLEDATTLRLQSLAAVWRPITHQPDSLVAQQILDDKIDILIDLAGHTAHHRLQLFARRPAPLQLTWLGYPNTTGLSSIAYRITDRHADPTCPADFTPTPSPLHSEKLIALPTAWCFHPPAAAPDVAPLPALTRGHLTFACFNNLLKLTPEMLALWADILRAIPKSRLLLKATALGNLSARAHILEQFSTRGISPLRIDLRPIERDPAAHLAMYNTADIALDTFPYHGTATTCEALFMGLPVITRAGQSHLSRVGVSLLTSAGLADCIAPTPEAYTQIALTLSQNLLTLAARRAALRPQMLASPLCNAPAFAQDFTTLLESLANHL